VPVDPAVAKAVFLEAVALEDLAARGALVDARCGEDAELFARVHALLDANDRALAGAGTASLGGDADAGAAAPTADYPGRDERAGAVIGGKYALVEPIGEGGMGAVWRAKQTEPVKRFVAVKLIKAGMDSKQVLARFEAERQALALMDHPNIAKVLDGGLHEGRPFFVMELVKGVPITEFCDARKLTPRERLELFVPVCQAIQHAHQKGVIHRDIKPSNVLVALYDDKPVVKVIDFGVAKATGAALTERTIDTGFGGVVGTPQYMSPEQATFNNIDVDTRSDVYALGVLLYELLTGSPPLSKRELDQKGLLEILRVVREEKPPRPSTKLSTSAALPSISADRGTAPNELTGLLRDELDWIVMRALEKDRTRRYETATDFAADVRRYLSGEPVHAHPPGRGYRVRKFLSRNRAAALTVALVLSALVAGTVAATWGLVEARRQRDAADDARRNEARQRTAAESERAAKEKALADERAARRAERAERERTDQLFRFFSNRVIAAARPRVEGGLGPSVTVLEALDAAEREIGADFANQPEIEGALRLSLGKTFATLGLYDRAEAQLRRADEAYDALKDGLGRRVTELALLNLRVQRLLEVRFADTRDRAAGLLDETRLVMEVTEGRKNPTFAHARNLLRLAQVRLATGAYREAEADFRECIDVLRRIDRDNEWGGLARAQLGECLTKQKRYAEAEEVLLACHADMTRRAGAWLSEFSAMVPEVGDRLIDLYLAWDRPAKVAHWRAERAKYPFVAPMPRKKW